MLAAVIFLISVSAPGLVRTADAVPLPCGTILDSGAFVLDSDIGPCDDPDGPVALTVNGSSTTPATLDMAGFSVICQDLNGKKGIADLHQVAQGVRARCRPERSA
jgi:hypothetical protein